MQSEEWWLELERQLDDYADYKAMHEQPALEVLEQYRVYLVDMLYEINEQPQTVPVDELEAKPLNGVERFEFIAKNSFHFMRYQQMKTLRQELKKINAVQQIRKKRQQRQ